MSLFVGLILFFDMLNIIKDSSLAICYKKDDFLLFFFFAQKVLVVDCLNVWLFFLLSVISLLFVPLF